MIRNVTYDVVPADLGLLASQVLGVGDGTEDTFADDLSNVPVAPGSVSIVASTITAVDDGAGKLTGTGVDAASTIDYNTGAVSLVLDTPPASGVQVIASYSHGGGSSMKVWHELEPTIGGVLVSQKIVPSNIVNAPANPPMDDAALYAVFEGSQDGETYALLTSGKVAGGGAKSFDWGLSKYPYVRGTFYSSKPAVAYLSLIWNNPRI